MRVTAPRDYMSDWDMFSRPVLQSRMTGKLESSPRFSNEDLQDGLNKLLDSIYGKFG